VQGYCLFLSSRRRHTRYTRDWSSDVCSSDLNPKYSQILCHIMSQRWMGGANLPSVRGASTSRYVALVAVLTALFTAYGYVSSVELRAITHSVDLFFLLPAFFAILISLTATMV